MDPSRLTPGVKRILALADDLARESGAGEADSRHLLHALSREESRGSEILLQHGLSPETLAQEISFDLDTNRSSRIPLPDVLNLAELESARQGRYAELGSEHLLWGLAAGDSLVADTFKTHGLSRDRLKAMLDVSAGHPDSPLAVDFQLSESSAPASDPTDLHRILDAAANRVREGVRVLEDAIRFARDHGHLTGLLKTWRHDLRAALSDIDDDRLLSSRDTAGDVGTGLNTAAEQHRRSLDDVVRANCKRVQEGLRSLEEFGKILSPIFGQRISQLRYRFYTLEKLFAVESDSRQRLHGRSLYLLLTRESCRCDWDMVIRGALNAGVDLVQLREKTLSDRELMTLGKKARDLMREAGALFIMNDRPDLAVLLDADGVHVGQDELTVREARRIVGPDRLIGVSTHTIEQARQAVEDGANYLGVGPVFSSATKNFSQLAGLDFVRQVAEEITLPWFAIGGISPETLPELLSAGAQRIAVSHAVCGSSEPGEAALRLKEAIRVSSSEKR